jgi:hypothetical protein
MPELKVPVSSDEIIEAVNKMKKHDRNAFIENLLAITSPEHLQRIKEVRAEHKTGKVKTPKDVFEGSKKFLSPSP